MDAGCTLAIAVENGQVYFGHIRPRQTTPSNPALMAQTTRSDLAYAMQQFGGFAGVQLTDPRHYLVYGGNAINEVSPASMARCMQLVKCLGGLRQVLVGRAGRVW